MTDMGKAAMPGGVVSGLTHFQDFSFHAAEAGERMGGL
jgi:hypothetical protein